MWEFHREIEKVAIFIAALKGCMSVQGWDGCAPAKPTRAVSPEQSAKLKALLEEYYPE